MILLPNFKFRVTFHFVSFRIHKRKKKTLFFFYLTLVLLTISYYNSKLNSTNIKKKTVKFFLLVFQICNSHSQQLILINIHNLELIFITSIAYFLSHAFSDRRQIGIRHFAKGRHEHGSKKENHPCRNPPSSIRKKARNRNVYRNEVENLL